MKLGYKTIETIATIERYGGKSFGLSWLRSMGYRVPPAICLPADQIEIDRFRLIEAISGYFPEGARFAVRSSALKEDAQGESFAGHFHSFTDIENIDLAINYFHEVKTSTFLAPSEIGVIFQQYIDASLSGVVFSSDPNTSFLGRGLISYIAGNSEELVSGKVAGEDVDVEFFNGQPSLSNPPVGAPKQKLLEIAKMAKEIESRANYPVDIEWCIEKGSNQLYFLQCRPITSSRFRESVLIEIHSDNLDLIPNEIRDNDKVKLRLACTEAGIETTKAFINVLNRSENHLLSENSFEIPFKSDLRNIGFSSILIWPNQLEGKVVRKFSGNSNNEVFENISEIFSLCFSQFWRGIILTHELFPLEYMGIIRRLGETYIIELSRGGFIQKGITECSRFVIDKVGVVLEKNEIVQENSYEIGNSEVRKVNLGQIVSLPDETFVALVTSFQGFLKNQKQVVEFGLQQINGTYFAYLIDFQTDVGEIDLTALKKGIISKGDIIGKIRTIALNDDWKAGVEMHFHDSHFKKSVDEQENLIFIVDRPDISLLELLNNYRSDSIGFLFRGGSMLSHLCIVLRERGIPARFISRNEVFKEGEIFALEAL